MKLEYGMNWKTKNCVGKLSQRNISQEGEIVLIINQSMRK
jgi:hypothetical protein